MLQLDEEEFGRLYVGLGLTAQEILIEMFIATGRDPKEIAPYFDCSPQAIRKQHIRASLKKGVEFEDDSMSENDS